MTQAFVPLPAMTTNSMIWSGSPPGLARSNLASQADDFLDDSDGSISSSASKVISWYTQQPFRRLLPKEDAVKICQELLQSQELIKDSEKYVIKNWDKFLNKLREESRSMQQLLGEETTDRILKSVESLDSYDADTVRTFLGSEAINALFSKVLYDGIFEFFELVDIFGNIVKQIPIIGPIREQIKKETKRNLDRTLGPSIQKFLSTYTRIAVMQAGEYILSPANRKAFGSANVKLITSLLQRPVNTLPFISDVDLGEKLRRDAFAYLRAADMSDIERYLDYGYDLIGDKCTNDLIDTSRVLDASPTLRRTVDKLWTEAKDK